MFKKVISSLIISSLLHIDTALCMLGPEEDDHKPKSSPISHRSMEKQEERETKPPILLPYEKKEEEPENSLHELQQEYEETQDFEEKLKIVRELPNDKQGHKLRVTFLQDIVIKENISQEIRIKALHSLSLFNYLIENLEVKQKLHTIILPFLEDSTLPLKQRLTFLRLINTAPSEESLLRLIRVLKTEDVNKIEIHEIGSLIKFAIYLPETEFKKEVEEFLSQYPEIKLQVIPQLPLDAESTQARLKYALDLVLDKNISEEIRIKALQYISANYYSIREGTTKEKLNALVPPLLVNSKIPVRQRLTYLHLIHTFPPDFEGFLLPLLDDLKTEDINQYSTYDIAKLVMFVADFPDTKLEKEVDKLFKKYPNVKLNIIPYLPIDEKGNQLRVKYLLDLAMEEETSQNIRLQALESLSQYSYFIEDENVKESLSSVALPLFEDEKLPLTQRLSFLALVRTVPSESVLLDLVEALKIEDISQYELGKLTNLVKFAINFPDSKFEKELQALLSKYPKVKQQIIPCLLTDEKELRARLKYALDLIFDESIPQEIRIKAIESGAGSYHLIEDETIKSKLHSTALPLFKDKTIPFTQRTFFLSLLNQAPPQETLLHLLQELEGENVTQNEIYKFSDLLHLGATSTDPAIQWQMETVILKHLATLIGEEEVQNWLKTYLEKNEETKKASFLEKILEIINLVQKSEPSEERDVILFAAKLLLQHSTNPNITKPASEALWHVIETTERKESYIDYEDETIEDDHAIKARSVILKYSQDGELKNKVTEWLFEKAQEETPTEHFIFKGMCLGKLLKQQNKDIKLKALQLCDKIITQTDIEDPNHRIGLIGFFPRLKELEETELYRKIQDKLLPVFEELLSLEQASSSNEESSKDESINDEVFYKQDIAYVYLYSQDEKIRSQAYEFLKNKIIEGNEDEAHEAVARIVEAFEEAHPWAQEAVDLATKRENAHHPQSPFALHQLLLEKMKEPVEHHLSTAKLEDGRIVQFNLDTLKTRRHAQKVPPMPHTELVRLTKQLIEEVNGSNEAYDRYTSIAGARNHESLLDIVKEEFFKRRLDDQEATTPERLSLTSLKLRHVLAKAKLEKSQASSGLSRQSEIILQLLINVLNCHTNKEDGIDNTYRLLGGGAIVSEEDMQRERLKTIAREFFMEDLRQRREGLLNGEGVVVKRLLLGENTPKDQKIEEPPHQAKYLLNLLGDQIGTFLEGKTVSFDTNGGAVDKKLRQYSKQQVLDTLHLHHKPEDVIKDYSEKFNTQQLKLDASGNDRSGALMAALFSMEELRNPKYVQFVNNDPEDDFIGWTPLAVAEALIRLGILEVVNKP